MRTRCFVLNTEAFMVHRRPVELQRSGPREPVIFHHEWDSSTGQSVLQEPMWRTRRSRAIKNNLAIFSDARTALDGFLEVCDHEEARSGK